MLEGILLGIVAVLLAVVLIGQWLNMNQIVAAQLATHKMMFPPQIRNARRVYWRGLLRQQPLMARLNTTAKVLSVLAGFGWFAALAQAFPNVFDGLHLRAVRFVIDFAQTIPDSIMIAGGLTVIAAILWLLIARNQYQQLSAADASHNSGANDLYWTPPTALRRQYQLKLATHGLILIGAVILIFGTFS